MGWRRHREPSVAEGQRQNPHADLLDALQQIQNLAALAKIKAGLLDELNQERQRGETT